MSTQFDPRKGLIVVRAEIRGPKGSAFLPLALDTGATRTLIHSEALITAGYDPAQVSESLEVMTADSIVRTPIIKLKSIRCLGHVRRNFAVLCHDLPPTAVVAGLLGLDFLRGHLLTINFPKAEIELARRRRARRKRQSIRSRKPT